MRTIVYVDGYNLYYGLLRKTKFKWLDLFDLFKNRLLEPDTELIQVRYYTAPVLGRMCDDPNSPQRQRLYLQALRKMNAEKIDIIEGKILATRPIKRLVAALPEVPHLDRVQVHDFNEKKTDVNIAADLLADAWMDRYEQAVICSNDSDLEAALAAVRRHHPAKRIGLVAPISGQDHRRISSDLKRHSDWAKTISAAHLEHAQLPLRIPNSHLTCPREWRNEA